MLLPIEDQDQLEKLHKYFVKTLQNAAQEYRDVRITYQPRQEPASVAINKELNLWWHHKKQPDHYWGPFGSKLPEKNGTAHITVNITYKHKGTPLSRGSCFFAFNTDKDVLLVHTGDIRGGVKGVGKNGFWKHYRGPSEMIWLPNGKYQQVAIVGTLKSPLFARELSDFVHHVAEIKDFLKGKRQGLSGFAFNPEFYGSYSYQLPQTVTVQSNHGLIVNELTKRLKAKGLGVGNDQKMDIFIFNKKNEKVTHLLEVKTKLSTQNLYGAIVQLQFYGLTLPKNHKKIFVAPIDIKKEVIDALKKLKISVITFSLSGDKVRFFNLGSL